MTKTIFDKLIAGEIKSWIVWEDDQYIAFLTPFPNTLGLTVVAPKKNPGDYVFDLNDDKYCEFLKATKKVAKILQGALKVKRVALVFEGTGVAHVHAKLYPLYGKLAGQTNVWSKHKEFRPEYTGYLSTAEGPKMTDQQLDETQQKIVSYQKKN